MRPQPVRPAGAFPHLSYVNDARAGIIKDAIGAKRPDWERRVDRRTACLHQANAFREKALADPEHQDEWIDEAIKWLERAMEASCHAVITVDADVAQIPEPVRTSTETCASSPANDEVVTLRCCGNCSKDVTMLRVDTVPAAMLGRAQTETRVTSCSRTARPREPAVHAIGVGCYPC